MYTTTRNGDGVGATYASYRRASATTYQNVTIEASWDLSQFARSFGIGLIAGTITKS